MLSKLLNIFRIPDLRNKLLFTVALLCVYRIGFYVPLPGVNAPHIRSQITSSGDTSAFSMLSNYLSVFSGGDLTQGTIFGLGIMPYISASIILQLMGTVVPALEKLKKEGEPGVRKINEWTRYLTVGVCIVQAAMYARHFASAGQGNLYRVVLDSQWLYGMFFLLLVAALTAGSCFLMWLGEQIDHFGIGNGVSLIITAGIVARMPTAIKSVIDFSSLTGSTSKPISPAKILFLIACFIFVVAMSILLTEAQRRIPVQQAKHMRGRRVYGGSKQYLPLRVNHAGVMPIIFASTLVVFPVWVFRRLVEVSPNSESIFHVIVVRVANSLQPPSYLYEVLFCLLIFFFSYFWNTVQFQPKEMANQLRDYGSFIPGLRPGKRTADYLENVMNRITYAGAAFLCFIAIIPSVVAAFMLEGVPQAQAFQITQFLGGTGLLIVIQVMLDFVRRIEANLVMRNYGGFMDEGNDGGTPARNRRPSGNPNRGPRQPQPSNFSSDDPRGLPA